MKKTLKTLLDLVSGLRRNSMRSNTMALRAVKDDKNSLGKLFRAISESERIQSVRMLRLAHGRIGNTAENLTAVFETELPLLLEEFIRAEEAAAGEGVKAVAHAYRQSQRVCRKNLSFYRTIQQETQTMQDRDYYVCGFCGYVHENHAPVECPVCQAPKIRFKQTG